MITGTSCLIPRLLTFLQVFMHRRKQQERELGSSSYMDYFELYIANLYRPAYVSAYIYMYLILLNIRLFIFLTMLGDSFLTWLAINYP